MCSGHSTWNEHPGGGGLFEQMVGLMKRCLKKFIGQVKVTLDKLTTIVAEEEIP